MRALDLRTLEHPQFVFIEPTSKRINKSVAWRVRCKRCGKESLVGASQTTRNSHRRCIHCQIIPTEINRRALNDQSI